MPVIDDDIDHYLRAAVRERRLRPRTAERYRQELRLLMRACPKLDQPGVEAFVDSAADGAQLAPSTRNWRRNVVRRFCQWLVRSGRLRTDPSAEIAQVRVPRVERLVPSAREVGQVLELIRRDAPSPRAARDEALVGTLYYTGLRISELLGLDVVQVDLESRVLRAVLRKGGDRTNNPLHPVAAEGLRRWLTLRTTPEASVLFPGRRAGTRLTARAVQKRLQALALEAGLEDRLRPHALRHAHATSLNLAGTSSEVLRRSMNHRSLRTTERYLHSTDAQLRDAVERLPEL